MPPPRIATRRGRSVRAGISLPSPAREHPRLVELGVAHVRRELLEGAIEGLVRARRLGEAGERERRPQLERRRALPARELERPAQVLDAVVVAPLEPELAAKAQRLGGVEVAAGAVRDG